MARRWHELLDAWKPPASLADSAFEDIVHRYSEPGRFYHTLDHIGSVLRVVESLRNCTSHWNAVRLAVWLHDVICDSRAKDNEERSAEYAERVCCDLAIPDGWLVASLILKTKTHDAEDDADAQVLLDADLAILGASSPDYAIYADQIRQEYAWVPDDVYRRGRQQVLTKFLARPRIYHRLDHLETPARGNLAAEIDRLSEPRY